MNDFEVANPSYQPIPKVTRASEYRPVIDRPYSIKGLFHPNEVIMVAGAPGLGKTNVVAAACAHVAQGRPFGGRPVRRSLVVYYGAEDPEGVLKRAHPFLRDPACAAAPFFVVHGAPNLMDPSAVQKVRSFVEKKKIEHGCDTVVIVFDTLNRCLGGADENLASTMGAAIGNADQIAKLTNACVVLVHHVGAGNPDRPRGSSAQEGNLDGLYILKRPEKCDAAEKVVLLVPKKQKNTKPTGPLPFQLRSFFIGRDKDGDNVSVPYAVALEPSVFAKIKMEANENTKAENSGAERCEDLLRTLTELHKREPERFFSRPELAERSGSAFNSIRSKQDTLRKAIGRALDDLLSSGLVEVGEGGFRLANNFSVIDDNVAESA